MVSAVGPVSVAGGMLHVAARGVGVAHCPQSNMKVGAGVAPVPAMIEAGVAVGIGTDGAGANNDLNLWEEVDTAAKLQKVTSGDPTVMNARQALAMATIGGRWWTFHCHTGPVG